MEKKRKEKAFGQAGIARAVKVFLEKYYPEGGDFFKNPEGLTLTVLVRVGLEGPA